jgi:tricorn protease
VITKAGKGWIFSPQWSNDSKWDPLFGHDRTLNLIDAASGESKKVDQGQELELTEYNFSPDSKWIAYTKLDDNKVQSIYLYQIDGGKITKISAGFTADYSPTWDMKGRVLVLPVRSRLPPVLDTLDREFIEVDTTKPCCVILTKDGKSPFLADEVLGIDDEDDDKADKWDKDKGKDGSPTTQSSDDKDQDKDKEKG